MSNVSLVGKEEDGTKEVEEEKEEGATVKIQRLRHRENGLKVVQNIEFERIYSWVIYFF